MKRAFVLLFVLALTGMIPLKNAEALTKVAREMNFMTFYAGTSMPVATYTGTPGDPFIDNMGNVYEFEGSDVYDDALYLGFDYGKLYSGNLSFSIGFRYINHKMKNPIENDIISFSYSTPVKLNQYDLGAELQYRMNDIMKSKFTPYVGLSLFTGFTTIDWGGVENENRITVAMGAEFGAEFKIKENAANKNFVTLVSTNSYIFTASGDRPKYLHIGGALRFYFNN